MNGEPRSDNARRSKEVELKERAEVGLVISGRKKREAKKNSLGPSEEGEMLMSPGRARRVEVEAESRVKPNELRSSGKEIAKGYSSAWNGRNGNEETDREKSNCNKRGERSASRARREGEARARRDSVKSNGPVALLQHTLHRIQPNQPTMNSIGIPSSFHPPGHLLDIGFWVRERTPRIKNLHLIPHLLLHPLPNRISMSSETC